jgi:hypothetical protein
MSLYTFSHREGGRMRGELNQRYVTVYFFTQGRGEDEGRVTPEIYHCILFQTGKGGG